ncbi:hypothetical protein evm_015567, partial [Chilo suppressalis]
MRQTSDRGRWDKEDSGGSGGVAWGLALPGGHTRRARGGVLLRWRVGGRPVGAHRLTLCREPFRRERVDYTAGNHAAPFACVLRSEGEGASRGAPSAVQHRGRARQRHRTVSGEDTSILQPFKCERVDYTAGYYGQKVKVRRVMPHPQYSIGVAHDNDFALFQ